MKGATEIIGDKVPRCAAWEWTCLPCDSTWIGDAADHVCDHRADWRRDFWIQRLRWVMPAAARDELAVLTDAPIARERMVELFGDRWKVESDAIGVQSKPTTSKAKARQPYSRSRWPEERAADMVGWIEAHEHLYPAYPPIGEQSCSECGAPASDEMITLGLPGYDKLDRRVCLPCWERIR